MSALNPTLLLLLCVCALEGALGLALLRALPKLPPPEDGTFVTLSAERRGLGLMLVRVALFATAALSAVRLTGKGFSLLYTAGVICLVVVLWVCAWSDLNTCLIPNRVIAVGLLEWALLTAARVMSAPEDARYLILSCFTAAGMVTAAGLLCRIVASGALGFGDIKLMLCMGLFLGLDMTWNAMLCSMLVIFVASVVLLLTKRVTCKSSVPFAPALLAGTLLAILL